MLSNLNLWSYLYKDSSGDVGDKKVDCEKEQTEEINNDTLLSTEKAKEWGSYILGVGKTATNIAAKQVSETAKQIRQNVSDIGIIEQSNIISKFSDEQTRFKEEKRLLEKKKRETCFPWFDALNEEDESHILKAKILSISNDERNFIRNPPSGSGFDFNYDLYAPVAQLLLKEDDVLADMRYRLVPKKIPELTFWRNYFYRVFLIKQSLHGDVDSSNCVETVQCDELSASDSTAGERRELSNEEIQQLISATMKIDGGKENEEWEAELQKELSEFELVNDDNDQEVVVDDDDLEREILSELEK